MLAELRRARWAMTEEIMRRRRKGVLSARNVESQRRSKWRGIEGAVASFEAVARGVGEQGAGHAADEIARQTRVAMAVGDIRVGGRRVMQPLVHAFEEAVKVVAEFSLSGLWQSMLDEAIGEFLRLDRQGLAADEIDRRLEDFLDSLSEKPLRDRARRAVGVVYNQGRHMSLMTAKAANVAAYAVRSELLDQNTCSECQMLDGSVVEIGSPQYEALMPPARCLGQERCRGFYVALARDITEAA